MRPISPQHAGRIANHYRRLRAARIIDPHTYAVADTLLWRLRRAGAAVARGSYAQIARLAGVSRSKCIAAVAQLTAIGVLAKQTHRIDVRWGFNRALRASRQAANTYEFAAPSTESTARPVEKRESKQDRKELLTNSATDLLAARRAAFAAGRVAIVRPKPT